MVSRAAKRKIKEEELRVQQLSDEEKELEDLATSYEIYYELGVDRSLADVSTKTGISFEQLKEWSELHAWDEKIAARTKDLDRAFEAYYKGKSRDIRNRLITQIEGLIGTLEAGTLGMPFDIKTIADFRALTQAYESLARANALAINAADSMKDDDTPTSWSDLLGHSDHEDTYRGEDLDGS